MVHKVLFKLNKLKSLVDSSKSCIKVKEKCNRSLTLLPVQLANVKLSVRECLDSMIATYDANLDGIVLSFKGVSILDSTALGDDGEVKVKYVADVYLFRPDIGSILTGIVHKQSEDNIGCLVHKIFNATIPYENQAMWNLSIGQEITFKVVELDYSGPLPFIKGKLLETSMPEIHKDDDVDSGLGGIELVVCGIQRNDGQTYFEANHQMHPTKKKKKHNKRAIDTRNSDISVRTENNNIYCEIDQDLRHPNIAKKKKQKVHSKNRNTVDYVDTISCTIKGKTKPNIEGMVLKQNILLEKSNYKSSELIVPQKQETKDCGLRNIERKSKSELNVSQKRKKDSLEEIGFESVSQLIMPKKNKKKVKLNDDMIIKNSENKSKSLKSEIFNKDHNTRVAEIDIPYSYYETGKCNKSNEHHFNTKSNTISSQMENSSVPFSSAENSTKHLKKKNKNKSSEKKVHDSINITAITNKILDDIMVQNKENKCFKTRGNDNPDCMKSKKEDKQPAYKKNESTKKTKTNEEMDLNLIKSKLLSDVVSKSKQTSYKTERINSYFIPNQSKEDETPNVKCSSAGDSYEVKQQKKKKGRKKSEGCNEINVDEVACKLLSDALAKSKDRVNKEKINQPETLQIVEKPSTSSLGTTGVRNGPIEQKKMESNTKIKDDEIGMKKWKKKKEGFGEVNINDLASRKLLTGVLVKSKQTAMCKEVLSEGNLNELERVQIGETPPFRLIGMTGKQNKLLIQKNKKSKRKISEEGMNLEKVGSNIKDLGEIDIDDITSKLLNKVLSKSKQTKEPSKEKLNAPKPIEIMKTSSGLHDIKNKPLMQKKKKSKRKINNEDITLDDIASKMIKEYLS